MNIAQRIHLSLGAPASQLLAHLKGKLPSFTKKGSGRKSQRGKRK